jgi:hypothetical protein
MAWIIEIRTTSAICPYRRVIDGKYRCGRDDDRTSTVIPCTPEKCPFLPKDKEG